MKRAYIILLTVLSLTAGSLAMSQTPALYTFADIVTDPFVDKAMQVVIQECDWNDLTWSITEDMCSRIRQLAYDTYFSGFGHGDIERAVWAGNKKSFDEPEPVQVQLAWKIYRSILEAITTQFSDPDYLRHFYARHKPAFVDGLRKAGKAEQATLRFSVVFHGLDPYYNKIMERRNKQNGALPAVYQEIVADLVKALRADTSAQKPDER
ncbi:hypothetical protein HY491_04625 [Candidatus Woesearchaeota archaeon]|nr:hypothetical protein [Candidatus Woesearchaeota archaeon]